MHEKMYNKKWVCVGVCMCVYSVERIECEGDDDRCCVRVENW